MKNILVLFSFIFSFVAVAALPPIDSKLAYNMEVRKISEDVFMVTDVDYRSSNVLVVKMSDGTVVLASSPFENIGTQTLLDWVNSTLKPKHIVEINTHFHMDGTGGNEIYKKNGVEVWSFLTPYMMWTDSVRTSI